MPPPDRRRGKPTGDTRRTSAGTRARLRPHCGMQQRPRNPYSSAEIDRSSHERENEERMIELASSGEARFVPIDSVKNLAKTGGNPEAGFLEGMVIRAVAQSGTPPNFPGHV